MSSSFADSSKEKPDAVLAVPAAAEEDLMAHLPEHEAAILRAQIEVKPVPVSYLKLFRYATPLDIFLLVVAHLCAIAAGAALPLMSIVMGSLTKTFTDYFSYNGSPTEFSHAISKNTLYLVYIGIATFALIAIETAINIDRGEVLSSRIREHYLAATLRQNVAYFDKLGSGEITTRITADTNLIQEGISEKVGIIIVGLSTFVTALIVGFIKSWKLTLILFAITVAVFSGMSFASRFMIKYSLQSLNGASVGSTIVEEVFSSDRLTGSYDTFLAITEKASIKQEAAMGCIISYLWMCIYCNYALGFWQGSHFVSDGSIGVNAVITVLMSMLLGNFALSQVAPHARSITEAVAAASKIFATIDRVPIIDSTSEEGVILETVKGDIELKDVKFIYPSRPDVTVLDKMNLKIPAGHTVALVGASGSGKSTIIGIIERFYEILGGEVTIDGHDISELNTKWLRQQISLVSQEPTLFGCSIYENIAHGLIGSPYENASDDVKRKLIIEACETANAWSFIQTLPEGLDTNVGERGFLMSGGQKQRIAIARAMVGNPKILLLDEATSALDTKSEGVVQEALDRAARDRTTIVIAHRLSTIKDADLIVVMSEGVIVEQGTHNELLDKQGIYASLVENQKIEKRKSGDKESDAQISTESEEKKLEMGEDTRILDLVRSKTTQSISSANARPLEVIEKKHSFTSSIKMIARFNKPEVTYTVFGIVFAIINGLGYPVQAVFFGKCVGAFQALPSQYGHMRSQVRLYAGLYFMLACVEFIAYLISLLSLAIASKKLVRRIRLESFRQILRQDISYFDRDENTTGALTSTLSTDAQNVEGLSGATFGQILNSATTVVAGLIMSIAIGWKLGLVCGACVPIVVGSGYLRFHLLAKFQQRAKKAYESSASYACEAASAIRTVTSLTREADVYGKYKRELDAQIKDSRIATLRSSLLYGISQGVSFLISALGFWYGSTLLKTHEYSTVQFFIVFISVIFGSQSAGVIFAFAPDMGKAKQASRNILRLFESVPLIDSWSTAGATPQDVIGDIEFRDVHFRYPTRPEVPVLRGLDLTIKSGQYVALVGSSGCGKSTAVGLIESFYLPSHGQILLDGQSIHDFNVNAYREYIALVQQEPVLYAGSIKYNISLGTSRNVTDEEIFEVAREANIHDFIMSLPDGYDTLCGSKGALLSGGQKQRVAIARALIRQPKILLLDEATSALDSESEKVVQEALDKAAKGRTTVAVAHRLSTIQNVSYPLQKIFEESAANTSLIVKADVIYVFENGKVLESGTHQQLLANRSKYYELVQLQALERN
ncbi:P-loop containing nucleoside triphosphate hydrolase protein [Kockiozyma suomiensis]|uniref:P-loop containing nucleoside triphosphate hydrolase protein n=1 Tax=Kockiozyma suomiensis TaxID=1337062 RepID=UPI003344361B